MDKEARGKMSSLIRENSHQGRMPNPEDVAGNIFQFMRKLGYHKLPEDEPPKNLRWCVKCPKCGTERKIEGSWVRCPKCKTLWLIDELEEKK